MISFWQDLLQMAPLWSLSLMAFIPLTAKVLNKNTELNPAVVSSLYALAILTSFILFVFIGFNNKELLFLQFDPYSSGACLLVALSGLISLVLFHFNSWTDKTQLTETLFFLCQGILGLYVFCLAGEFMTAFIGLELASLMIYLKLAMSRKELLCLEAAIKYFVLSALSGVIFLYGLSFLYGGSGTLEINKLFAQESVLSIYNRFFFLGWALVFSALFFKMALFPFHLWLADVYQGSLTPMTAFMALAVKSSIVLFLGKIFSLPFFEKGSHGSIFLSGLAIASVLTVLFGNIMALKQIKIKRLIAFSSLAHSGYLMMALFGILSLDSSSKNLSLLFYYLLAYIFLTGAFLIGLQSMEKENPQIELKTWNSLFKDRPFVALGLTLCLLGLAGIPPSFGFFAKLGLFQPLILSGSWWVLFWAFVGSAIGLYYYVYPVTIMLAPGTSKTSLKWPWLAKGLFWILTLLGLFGGFLFGRFFY